MTGSLLRGMFSLAVVATSLLAVNRLAAASEISGDYVESRTCDIFTGPCFANAQMGVTGREAIMAWSVDAGTHNGVDLTGLKVLVAVRASDTLNFGGGIAAKPDPIRSVVVVDERASASQRAALVDFARKHAGKAAGETTKVLTAPFSMNVDHVRMVADLKAGSIAELATRKLAKGDCVCTNEEIYYPPLTEVDNYAPAYTLQGKFAGRGLGGKWTNPKTRSAFLATFAY